MSTGGNTCLRNIKFFIINRREYMKSIVVGIAAASLMIAGSAMAVDMPAVAKAKCSACHSIEKKVVGPAWNDVAKKYAGKKDAADTIAANITKGGAFDWKMGSMPPGGMGATPAEAKELGKFIAGLGGDKH
jgi:cytochrome c